MKRFVNIAAVARRKLRQLEIAGRLDDLRVPPGNRLESSKATVRASTAFVSTINGVSAFVGRKRPQKMSKSWTTIEVN